MDNIRRERMNLRPYRPSSAAVVLLQALFLLAMAVGMRVEVQAMDPASKKISSPQIQLASPFADVLFRVDFDAAGRFLASSHPNKSATLWDMEQLSPKSAKTFRVPLRNEQSRLGHAIALSPDAKFVAYSVPVLVGANKERLSGTGRVYVFQREKPEVKPRILTTPELAASLRFSPDGQYLAGVLANGGGLIVWSVTSWSEMQHIKDGYGPSPEPLERTCENGAKPASKPEYNTSYLTFAGATGSDVWLVTSGDTGIKTYRRTTDGGSVKLELLHQANPAKLGLCRPAAVDISPTDGLLAVGDHEQTRVAVVRLQDLTLQHTYNYARSKNTEKLLAVAWIEHKDRRFLFAAGESFCPARPNLPFRQCALRWDDGNRDSGSPPELIDVAADTVFELRRLPSGNEVLVAGARSISVVDADGTRKKDKDGKLFEVAASAFDFRNNWGGSEANPTIKNTFHVSGDARRILFDHYDRPYQGPEDTDDPRLEFNLAKGLSPIESSEDDFFAPDQDSSVLTDWFDNRNGVPKIKGKDIAVLDRDSTETFRAAAIARANGEPKYVLLGSSKFLRLVSRDGEVRCSMAVRSEAYRVNIASNAEFAVVGHLDGTIRWYRILAPGSKATCRFEIAMSAHISGSLETGWTAIVWEPGGCYKRFGSAKGAAAVGWLEFDDESASITPFKDFPRYNRPDAVDRAFDDRRSQCDASDEIRNQRSPIEIEILDEPEWRFHIQRLTFRAKEDSGDASQSTFVDVRVMLNDFPIAFRHRELKPHSIATEADWRTFSKFESLALSAAGNHEIEIEITADHLSERNKGALALCLEARFKNAIPSPICTTTGRWTGSTPLSREPRHLSAIVIGISRYGSPGSGMPDLSYSQNDAIDLVRLILNDFDARRASPENGPKAEFDSVRIDLFVAATADTNREIEQLRKRRDISVHSDEFTALDILHRIEAVRENSRDGPGQLVLIYFSGHGMTGKNPQTSDLESYLLLPGFDPNKPAAGQGSTSITSTTLIESLKASWSEKVIVLDACQDGYRPAKGERLFEGQNVASRLVNELRGAHVFLSTANLEPSYGQSEFVFEDFYRTVEKRDLLGARRDVKGNGLFTAIFLESLVPPHGYTQKCDGRVRPADVDRYVSRFFDPQKSPRFKKFLVERSCKKKPEDAELTEQVCEPKPKFVEPDYQSSYSRIEASENLVLRSLSPGKMIDPQNERCVSP